MPNDSNQAETWVHDGRECKMTTTLGHWCGYAKTPLKVTEGTISEVTDTGVHRLIDVHGGITYGPDDEGWVGFDTGHSRDFNVTEEDEELREGHATFGRDDELVNVWRPEDVREEVNKLADQLTLLESFVSEVAGDVE